ncbi:chemotaxis protein CheD [Motiliproteus sp. SC1-56]|uniref:chemotaxis protein CheD n=1 Tax=Motiliproteus sp. SC1-56 TaxID=2799565 RepID=UPI001A8E21EC|nr:chemotaxis protein CheD [Motiliproteus sp. SC1-56]
MQVLKPGDFYFGSRGEQIKTLLGSCVAITLWHPQQRIGGMCHFLLPDNGGKELEKGGYDGRYADQVMAMFKRELVRTRTRPRDYQVKVFGGGNMFPQLARQGLDIGQRNIGAARRLLHQEGFRIRAEHVGKSGHRAIILELETGRTWVRWQGQGAGNEH